MVTVLVVDDEPRISRLVRDYLDQAGFGVVEAGDGQAAMEAFRRHQPDLVIVDLGLPDMDGLDVIRELRSGSDVPIIILSARTDETDRVVVSNSAPMTTSSSRSDRRNSSPGFEHCSVGSSPHRSPTFTGSGQSSWICLACGSKSKAPRSS